MKGQIKLTVIVIVITISVFLFSLPIITEARSGCCSWHGGVCGCQCCDGTPLSATCAPYYPECGGGYYSPPTPSCPSMSSYDSLSGSCKCYAGYVASGGSCISADQYCRNSLGFNSRYNILTDKCECSYGYIISGSSCVNGDSICHSKYGYNSSYESSTSSCKCDYGYVFDATEQCVSRDEYCQDIYGYHSEYSSLKGGCKCRSGYVFNSGMTSCIDGDSYCQGEHGLHSSYDSLSGVCECDYGYEFKNNQCEHKENRVIYPPIIPKPEIQTETQPKSNTEPKPEPEIKSKDNNTPPVVAKQPLRCDAGYVSSFDKKYCVKIPENAHAVNSLTDLWLCNDGYKEINNACLIVSQEQKTTISTSEESTQLPVAENNLPRSKTFIRNIWQGASVFFVKIFNKIFK